MPFARLQTTQAWHPGKLTDYALPDEQLATGLEVLKDLPKPRASDEAAARCPYVADTRIGSDSLIFLCRKA